MTSEQSASAAATSPAPSAGGARRSRGWLAFARDVVVIVLIAILVSFLVKTFLVRSFYIPSGSMEDTLQVNDRILVDEITPRFSDFARGDVIVFEDPGGWLPPQEQVAQSPLAEGIDWLMSLVGLSTSDSEDHLVKRVIGLPGDHVVCCNNLGQITVNGVAIDESAYIKVPTPDAAASGDDFDVTVPAGSLWVLGDNRYRSKDSRYNTDQPGEGFVPVENVVGRAFLITWPLDRFGLLDFHHDRFSSVPEVEPDDSQSGDQ
ncbi:signal peptidase I [Microbacterium sp. C7(2022)]|uniref:signal peptidase I n=1 Tax=Microbacterium sp. C7(2022) TaxID=2992759 RepID=UPI00237A6187|nr:signal peptidase I [Microbacterium sp. C7(2022)]MDE0546906.1 signal peptidase I [Microbacterium sp. C7(2022)]